MAFSFTQLWPRAEVARLRRENESLSVALRNATEKAAESQARLEELRNRECPTCKVLQQTVNSLMFAAGSKIPMFDGVGPTIPKPEPRHQSDEHLEQEGRQRASKVARNQRRDFLEQFMQAEAQIPITESEPS